MIFNRSSRGHEQRSEHFLRLAAHAELDGSASVRVDTAPPEQRVVFAREARTHAMKACLRVINAAAHLCEGELAERNRQRTALLDRASARLLELIDEPTDSPSPTTRRARPP